MREPYGERPACGDDVPGFLAELDAGLEILFAEGAWKREWRDVVLSDARRRSVAWRPMACALCERPMELWQGRWWHLDDDGWRSRACPRAFAGL